MNIGDNLRVLRTKQNISQQEIADFLGIDRKTYIGWEAGECDIKVRIFQNWQSFCK